MTISNWEIDRTSPQRRFMPRIVAFQACSPYDTQSQTLGKRIIACRRAMGLSQKELTRRLSVDPSTLGQWEGGDFHRSVARNCWLSWIACWWPAKRPSGDQESV